MADDAIDLRVLMQTRLGRLDDIDVVATVADGLQALEAVAAHDPDVVLLDLSMPRLDGLETATRLRADHPDLTIIVLSGHPAEAVEERVLQAGADAYVEKQYDLAVLVETVRLLISGRNRR